MVRKPKRKPGKRSATREELPTGLVTLTPFVLHAGQTVSDPLNAASGTIVGLVMPTKWEPAYLTFQVSFDGAVWLDLYDIDNKEVGIHTTAVPWGAVIDLTNRPLFKNVAIRVRSGTRAASITQPEDCTFTAVIAP